MKTIIYSESKDGLVKSRVPHFGVHHIYSHDTCFTLCHIFLTSSAILVVDAKRTSISQRLLNFKTKILGYVSDAPNTLIGGVNVFHVKVAIINH